MYINQEKHKIIMKYINFSFKMANVSFSKTVKKYFLNIIESILIKVGRISVIQPWPMANSTHF